MQYQFRKLGQMLRYKKAMPQRQADGQWCVEVNLVKHADGHKSRDYYVRDLPTLHRAKSVSRVLNLAL